MTNILQRVGKTLTGLGVAILATGSLIAPATAAETGTPTFTSVETPTGSADQYELHEWVFDWSAPETPTAGDTFTLVIPTHLNPDTRKPNPIVASDGTELATTEQFDRIIQFTLTDAVTPESTGTYTLYTTWNMDAINNDQYLDASDTYIAATFINEGKHLNTGLNYIPTYPETEPDPEPTPDPEPNPEEPTTPTCEETGTCSDDKTPTITGETQENGAIVWTVTTQATTATDLTIILTTPNAFHYFDCETTITVENATVDCYDTNTTIRLTAQQGETVTTTITTIPVLPDEEYNLTATITGADGYNENLTATAEPFNDGNPDNGEEEEETVDTKISTTETCEVANTTSDGTTITTTVRINSTAPHHEMEGATGQFYPYNDNGIMSYREEGATETATYWYAPVLIGAQIEDTEATVLVNNTDLNEQVIELFDRDVSVEDGQVNLRTNELTITYPADAVAANSLWTIRLTLGTEGGFGYANCETGHSIEVGVDTFSLSGFCFANGQWGWEPVLNGEREDDGENISERYLTNTKAAIFTPTVYENNPNYTVEKQENGSLKIFTGKTTSQGTPKYVINNLTEEELQEYSTYPQWKDGSLEEFVKSTFPEDATPDCSTTGGWTPPTEEQTPPVEETPETPTDPETETPKQEQPKEATPVKQEKELPFTGANVSPIPFIAGAGLLLAGLALALIGQGRNKKRQATTK